MKLKRNINLFFFNKYLQSSWCKKAYNDSVSRFYSLYFQLSVT